MADAQERLALIEIVERDGRVRQQLDVWRWPLAIGRAIDNDLVLDDPHVAARHATLQPDPEGRLWIEVADTHNGVRVGARTLHAGERVALDAIAEPLHLGLTRLRVRRPGEPLAPEKALVGLGSPRALALTVLFTLALWGVLVAQHWLSTDPGADFTTWLPLLIGPPVALAVWCTAWALASKLFQQRFEFAAHWALAVRWLLGIVIAGALLTLAAAALGWPALFRAVGVVEAAALAAWLFFHARLVLPTHTRGLTVAFSVALVAGLGVMATLNRQREAPLVGPLYMNVLPHPGWRVANPAPPEQFVERALGLRAQLDARARAEPDGDDIER